MKREIRTDLALEEIEITEIDIKSKVEKVEDITITSVKISKEEEKLVNKKEGQYVTIEYADITDHSNEEKVTEIMQKELKKILKINNIKKTDICLIIGLGNRMSTPDSLGPLALDNILITKHLFDLNEIKGEGFRKTMGITPGVTGETGIETVKVINAIIEKTKPQFIIAIDALAAGAISRVNKTIQITDSGVHPGSGVGNKRRAINKENTGVPVIAIGIPTVVDAVTIVGDTIEYIFKHISYKIENSTNQALKSYAKDKKVKEMSTKENLLGILGTLSPGEQKSFIEEVLTPMGYNLMVTPKEIDFLIKKMATILSRGINSALHQQISLKD